MRLDHIGILVPSLAEAAAFCARLGFTLTRRAEHTRIGADGRIESAGSAQHSIMLEQGYVELQECSDDAHPLAPAARRYRGIHILAFGVDEAAPAHAACAARGLALSPVLEWSRSIAEPDLSGEARFAFFVGKYGAQDDSFLCWVEHRTPELLRNARLLRHANGARALAGVIVASEDAPPPLIDRYRACGGTVDGEAVRFGEGRIEIASRGQLPAAIAASPWPARAWVCAALLEAEDPAAFASRARALGCAVAASPRGPILDLRAQLGCFVILRQAA